MSDKLTGWVRGLVFPLLVGLGCASGGWILTKIDEHGNRITANEVLVKSHTDDLQSVSRDVRVIMEDIKELLRAGK